MGTGITPIRQEILPPEERYVSSVPEVSHLPRGALGLPILARLRYVSEQKQIEAYRALVAAKNGLLSTLTEQQSLVAVYVQTAERTRHLDVLRQIARDGVKRELREMEERAELGQLRFEVERERLLLARDQYRGDRERLISSRPTPAPSPSVSDGIRKLCGDIEEIDTAFAETRSSVVNRFGGEANLPEHVRQQLDKFEFMRNILVEKMMAEVAS
jgi:hypothetical protein